MKYKKRLFKVDEMDYRTWNERNTEENIIVINLEERTGIRLEHVGFKEHIVSKIKVFKCNFKPDEDEDMIFVELFMGNVEIATRIYHSDVVFNIEYDENAHGEEYIRSYWISEAKDYDYRD